MNNNSKNIIAKKVLICDDKNSILPGFDLIILWNDFNGNNRNIISISQYVESNAELYKKLYLTWVYRFSISLVDDILISDYLILDQEFKYWPLTSIAQKFNISDCSYINDSIKLFALEQIILENNPDIISINLKDEKIKLTIKYFCLKSKINYKINSKKINFRLNIYKSLFISITKALFFFLKYAIYNIKINKKNYTNYIPQGQITFIDILIHFDKKAFSNGIFVSNYWTQLVTKLSELNIFTNWIYTYYQYSKNLTLSKVEKEVNNINSNSSCKQHHSLFESSISFDLLVSSLKIYITTLLKSIKLSLLNRNYYSPLNSNLNFEILFRNDFMDSLLGPNKILNLIRYKLFPVVLSKLPHQKLGFYIQEFQPWESILVYSWKKNSFGDIIGVPHSTIRYWDLRYFFDIKLLNNNLKDYYFPDKIAVNGIIAKEILINAGYPPNTIIEVEALRYLHLLENPRTNSSFVKSKEKFQILVCGDFLQSTNIKILTILAETLSLLKLDLKIYFKPHPAYYFNPKDIYQDILLIEERLDNILGIFDLVITSNISSSSVDAYIKGIPVFQFLDGKYFNMTPMRNEINIKYFSNSKDLHDLLLNFKSLSHSDINYFYLNNEIQNWICLIKNKINFK